MQRGLSSTPSLSGTGLTPYGICSACANGNLFPLVLFCSNLIHCQLPSSLVPSAFGKGCAESRRQGSQEGGAGRTPSDAAGGKVVPCAGAERPPPCPLPAIDSALLHLEALARVPLCSKCKGRQKNQFPSAEQCPLIYCRWRKKFFISFSWKGLLCCLLLGSDAVAAPFVRTLVF